MKYAAAFFIVFGLGIAIGAESHDWLPMFAAQIALGMTISFSGILFALQIGANNDS